MSKRVNGGPAFPVPGLQHDEDFNGMSLRDYFAAKAMQSLVLVACEKEEAGKAAALIPRAAYEIADAMLKARKA